MPMFASLFPQDAHLKPQLQLSGDSNMMSPAATAAAPPPSLQTLPEDEDTEDFVEIKVKRPLDQRSLGDSALSVSR